MLVVIMGNISTVVHEPYAEDVAGIQPLSWCLYSVIVQENV